MGDTEIPEGAFARGGWYSSITWEDWFPSHCYICHIANAVDIDDYEEDTSHCGSHCED